MAEFKHRKLKVWQDARQLVKEIYGVTSKFPSSERYALTDQLNRAAVSVPSNIAEGSSRETPADFIHFLVMARGSLAEIDTQLTLASDLHYMTEDQSLLSRVEALAARINRLIAHIRGTQS